MTSSSNASLPAKSRVSGLPAPVREALYCALVLGWLWFWRTNRFTGGDSEQWERMIHGGAWFQETQPGVFFLVQLVRQVIEAAFGGTARMAFAIVSCLSGVAAFAVVLRLFENTPSRAVRLALVCTGGFTTLFYGHIESYAVPAAALMFHLLCVKRSAEDRWPVHAIPLSYCLMISAHLVALFIFPAMALVSGMEAHRRAVKGRRLLALMASLVLPLVIWMIIRSLGDNRTGDSITYLLYVVRTLFTDPAELVDKLEPRLKVLFAFWNGGAVLLLLPQAWPQRGDRIVRYWAPYLLLLVGFTLVWGAARGEPDFDLHSFPWIMATLMAAWVYQPNRWSRAAVALILAINAGLWVSRTATFAEVTSRGSATLLVCTEALESSRQLLLDDRLTLRDTNRFVPSGPHRFTYFGATGVLRETFTLEDGETYRLCLDPDRRLTLERSGPP